MLFGSTWSKVDFDTTTPLEIVAFTSIQTCLHFCTVTQSTDLYTSLFKAIHGHIGAFINTQERRGSYTYVRVILTFA